MGELTWRGALVIWARPDDASRSAAFQTGRALLAQAMSRLVGEALPLDSTCEFCGRDHAAPRAPGIALSVSHTAGLTVVAASTESSWLGVDVESVDSSARVRDLADLFAPRPAPDLADWTRIEAAVKADGRGFRIPPEDVVPRRLATASDVPEWEVTLPGRPSSLTVATLAGPEGFVLSVARG